MSEFEHISVGLVRISRALIALGRQKNDYAKSINYHLQPLLEGLGPTTTLNDQVVLEEQKLAEKASARMLEMLYGRRTRTRNYLTPEDLCQYLHVSKNNLTRSTTTTLQDLHISAFWALLRQQEETELQLVGLLGQIPLQKWFTQVDFFSNGYIDTTALFEYLLHYAPSGETFEEYNALLIIRTIKRCTTGDKLFLQDIKDFIELEDIVQILLTNHNLSPELTTRPLVHFKRNSNQIQSLSSEFSIPAEFIKLGPKLSQKEAAQGGGVEMLSREQIDAQLQQEYNMTFEERLVKMHWRNERYMREAKRQMEGIIPLCQVQIHSQLQLHSSKNDNSQLLLKLRLLGDQYNKAAKHIRELILSNSKFSFINAYSLIDSNETNSVSLQDWLRFIKEMKIAMTTRKLNRFFEVFSTKGAMRYCDFLRVFKLKAVEDEFQRCQARYPLIYEPWSQSLTLHFKTVLMKLIRATEEGDTLRRQIATKREELTALVSKFTYEEELIELLGQDYKQFVHQYYSQDTLQLHKLLSY